MTAIERGELHRGGCAVLRLLGHSGATSQADDTRAVASVPSTGTDDDDIEIVFTLSVVSSADIPPVITKTGDVYTSIPLEEQQAHTYTSSTVRWYDTRSLRRSDSPVSA